MVTGLAILSCYMVELSQGPPEGGLYLSCFATPCANLNPSKDLILLRLWMDDDIKINN